MTLVGTTVASVWDDIFHHPDDETVLDDTLAYVRWMYSEWDGLSGYKKAHKTWPSTYICCGYPPHDKPRSNNRASVRAEAYKVHREFRTQRRPLNVASVLRRTVRAGSLTYLRPDRRFSYERPAT